jgi:hypothetical protein
LTVARGLTALAAVEGRSVRPWWSGLETKEKENHAMTRLNSHRNDPAKQPPIGKIDLDAYLIDEDFDNFLDRDVLAYRDLADLRNY